MHKYLLGSIVFISLLFGQGGTVLLTPPEMKGTNMEIPKPTQPELDSVDFKEMTGLLLAQQSAWNEANRKKAEYLEAEKKAGVTDSQVMDKLAKLKEKYKCQACDLSWQGKWSAMGNLKFAEK